MDEHIKALGALLKEQRIQQNLSLKEIENAISIRSGYLEAIEEGRIQNYLTGIYILGFLKQYIVYLGLDVALLEKKYPLAFKVHQENHEFDYGIGTLEPRGGVATNGKWFPGAFWISISILAVLIVWGLAKYLGFV
ncbi:MAG: helix-turn-helix domain-containing protein [Rhabdochlamydiaceae bacterium]